MKNNSKNQKYNSKGKGRNPKDDEEEKEVTGRKTKSTNRKSRSSDKPSGNSRSHSYNDPSWYISDPAILRDVASFPFSDRLGMPYTFKPIDNGTFYTDDSMVEPGVCAIKTIPYIGNSAINASSPVNIAGRLNYQEIRKANSGSINYDWPALMKYYITMDNCYMLWSYLVRLYGVACEYQYMNSYMPGKLLQAMGVANTDVVVGALANMRYYINNFTDKCNAFPVPAIMPYYVKHRWMFQNIYADGLTAKSQLYLYTPEYLYRYNSNSVPASLEPVQIEFNATTTSEFIDELVGLLNQFTNALYATDDISVIGGDIRKAYGPETCLLLPYLPDDYRAPIVYSEEVLRQIHNTTITAIDLESGAITGNILQDVTTNNLYQDLVVDAGTSVKLQEWVVNFDLDSVTPEDMITGTRMTTLVKPSGEIVGGDMICTGISMYANAKMGTLPYDFTSSFLNLSGTSLPNAVNNLAKIVLGSNFRYFPLQYVEHQSGSSAAHPDFRGFAGDMNNYTVLDIRELERMHQAAFMGLFAIPYGINAGRTVK